MFLGLSSTPTPNTRKPDDVSTKTPWMPWYYKDYKADPYVLAMGLGTVGKLQDLAYRRMLEIQWELGSLPDNPNHIAKLIGYTEEEFKKVWTFPLTQCWRSSGSGRLINKRAAHLRVHARKRSEQSRDAADKRWGMWRKSKGIKGKPRSSGRIAEAIPHGQCDPDPDPYPDPEKNNNKELTLTSEESEGSPIRKKKKDIHWDPTAKNEKGKQGDFVGEYVPELKAKLRDRYTEDEGFDSKWLWAQWDAMREYLQDKPEKAEEILDWNLFILGWYRRNAESFRTRKRK